MDWYLASKEFAEARDLYKTDPHKGRTKMQKLIQKYEKKGFDVDVMRNTLNKWNE